MIKIDSPLQQHAYLDWLEDFEFDKMGLPRPDCVILLDVPLAVTEQLMAQRVGKTGGQTGDIHEGNENFLRRCHEAYDVLAEKYQWQRISCAFHDEMRPVQAIHEEVYQQVMQIVL